MININQNIWVMENWRCQLFFILEIKGTKNNKIFNKIFKRLFLVMGDSIVMIFDVFSETILSLLKSITLQFFSKYSKSYNILNAESLDINTKNLESPSIELISKNSKITVLSTICRPPDGDFKALTLFWKMYIPFPWSPINFSMPPGTLTLTFSTTTKMKKLRNFWI